MLCALEIIGSLPPTNERERLAVVAFQNLALYLVNAGKAEEALWVIKTCKNRLASGGEIACLKTEWLLADIVGALGEIDSAVVTYEEVRGRFVELGLSQEVALITLDLSRLLLKPQPLRVRKEALSIRPIFEELGIDRNSREWKLLDEVIETGAESALVELSAALRSNALARRRRRA